VPVIVKVKFALPAATLVGETETICAWTVCGTVSVAAVFPPQPINHNPHSPQLSIALRTIPSFRIGNPLFGVSCSDFYRIGTPTSAAFDVLLSGKVRMQTYLGHWWRLRGTPGQAKRPA
jgi:hypothetical protein